MSSHNKLMTHVNDYSNSWIHTKLKFSWQRYIYILPIHLSVFLLQEDVSHVKIHEFCGKLWNWKKVHIWKNYDLRRMVSTLWCWWWVNPSHLETTWWSCLITTRRQYQKAGCLKASPLGSSAHYRTKTNNLFSNQ